MKSSHSLAALCLASVLLGNALPVIAGRGKICDKASSLLFRTICRRQAGLPPG